MDNFAAAIVYVCRTNRSNVIYTSGRRLAGMIGVDHTSMRVGINRLEQINLVKRRRENYIYCR
ncbi:hypothetical protein REC12_08290 [Desulfosporosinus sp. PR]|nr:hypothetical protein [Desulfosporosinus sp. PR]